MTHDSRLTTINRVLERHEPSRSSLIPLLQDVQEELGFLSEEDILDISRYLKITEAEIYGVATFYAQFRFSPIGENVFTVCRGTACHVRGSQGILEDLETELGISAGCTTEDLKFTIQTVACVGSCALAPLVIVNEKVYGRATKSRLKTLVKQLREAGGNGGKSKKAAEKPKPEKKIKTKTAAGPKPKTKSRAKGARK